jgi:hypothetical protein
MYENFPSPSPGAAGAAGVLEAYMWVVLLGAYLVAAFLQYRIAQRTGPAGDAWWAFIPIMNTLLLIKMAQKPGWWFLLLLVPGVNLVTFALLWMAVAQQAGQSAFWGILVLIPAVNVIALLVLALGERRSDRDYDLPSVKPKPDPTQQRRAG